MSIFKRLILGNLIVLLLVAFWGGAVIYKLGNLQKITQEIVEINGAVLIVGDRLLDSFASLMKFIKKYYVSGDKDYYDRVQELEILLEEDFGLINDLIKSDQQKSLFSDTKRLYMELMYQFEKNVNQLKHDGTGISLKGPDLELEQMAAYLKEIINLNKHNINKNIDLSNQDNYQLFFYCNF